MTVGDKSSVSNAEVASFISGRVTRDTEATHTPAPCRPYGVLVFGPCRDGREHWVGSADSPYVSSETAEANAVLWAAAPKMLAALKALVELSARDTEMNRSEPGGGYWSANILSAIDSARDAIAKATGSATPKADTNNSEVR